MGARLQHRGDLELGENQSVERYSRQRTKKSSRIAALEICQRDLTTQDSAHVEDSSQTTSFRKGFDHYVVHLLRDNIYQRADQLLFATTYVVNNDPLWRILSVIIVHGAHACYRTIDQSHLTKK